MKNLCVITDTSIQQKYSHVELAKLAIRGGADLIQLREKRIPTSQLLDIAKTIRELCRTSGVTFIVNDRVDIALLSGADGVHLGSEDFPLFEARRLLGSHKMIGATASSLEEALNLEKQGASYVGFGHIFPTQSKAKLTPPKGVDALKKICQSLRIPVLAIGGINRDNLLKVVEAEPWGVAVIGAVCASDDPEKATRQLKEALAQPSSTTAR